MFTILFFGDVVGKAGRRALQKIVPALREELAPDLVLANGENIAHGAGITKKTLEEGRAAGIDLFTSGNHVWNKEEVRSLLQDPTTPLIRPANYPADAPGQGHRLLTVGTKSVLVLNLLGKVFMEEAVDDPFRTLDALLKQYSHQSTSAIVVDFHCEATSEKQAFGFYADGRVSAVVGTHTHVGTADARILPKGTAYITDIGMVGTQDSVLGVDKNVIIKKFLSDEPAAHKIPEEGTIIVNAVLIKIDPKMEKAVSIERIDRTVEV